MKISLIAFSASTFGIRSISAYLKANGFKTQLILSPSSYEININDQFLESLFSIIKNSDIIGIAVQCNNYFDVIEITKYIKSKQNIPILWGGPQPIVDPENCIKFADIICVGEGEESVLELVKRMYNKENYENIPNLWFNKNSEIIKNPMTDLVGGLDKYAPPDYDISDHYIYRPKSNTFRKVSYEDMIMYIFSNRFTRYGNFKTYFLMTSRGCPHRCTYCANSHLRKIYKGQYLRKRSINSVINEIKYIKSKFPFVNAVSFEDDTFTIRPKEEIEEFSQKYKKEINLPFSISSTPLTLTETKLKALIDAGLTFVRIGVQTGSERVLREIYKRPTTNEEVLKTARLFHKYRSELKQLCTFDFIFDNPFETIDDQLETLNLITKIPRPYFSRCYSLAFVFGTELLEMARNKGYITDELSQVYNKDLRIGKFDYIRFFATVYPLFPFWIPNKVTNFLIKKETVVFLNKNIFRGIFKILTLSSLAMCYGVQGIKRIFKSGLSFDEIRIIGLKFREHFFTKSTQPFLRP